jgi:hypothetical protein
MYINLFGEPDQQPTTPSFSKQETFELEFAIFDELIDVITPFANGSADSHWIHNNCDTCALCCRVPDHLPKEHLVNGLDEEVGEDDYLCCVGYFGLSVAAQNGNTIPTKLAAWVTGGTGKEFNKDCQHKIKL